jgi:formylglycine-generating enzyme required for sulfatase activity
MRLVPLLLLVAAPAARAADPEGMVQIPATTFSMGEKSRQVTLSPFWIDRTEVTQKAYAACMAAGACTAPHGPFDPTKRPQLPVTSVDFAQASKFCTWAKKRLPTQAVWELAARGPGEPRVFPWGGAGDCRAANYGNGTVVHTCDNVNPGEPTSVGAHPRDKSPYGVFDLGGNVSEWLYDWVDEPLPVEPAQDPLGPVKGVRRAVRGGSWRTDEAFARVTSRNGARPDFTDDDLGFRCVQARPCQSPDYHQMDFWIGEWRVQSNGKPVGSNSVVSILEGCALAEHWTGPDKWEGTSYNAFDSATGKWHQQWVDNRGTVLHFAGQLSGGSMILEGDLTAGQRQRVTYTPQTPKTMRQLHEISTDSGKTWRAVFDGSYTRTK